MWEIGLITPPPWTCPDTENLCKVCVTGTDHPPPLGMWMTSHGQCPRGVLVNVQEWGCFSIFRRVDDVTRTMSKGGVLVNIQEWGCFSNFGRADDVTRTMSKGGWGCLWMSSPPFRKSCIRACIYIIIKQVSKIIIFTHLCKFQKYFVKKSQNFDLARFKYAKFLAMIYTNTNSKWVLD